tara:strand:+ start:646 stop:897 length:252 start_codon:yes stop_codon:yes gene_type:complete
MSIIEDCLKIKLLGIELGKRQPRQKPKPCRCESYDFPHRRYSGKCGQASAFTAWKPMYTFASGAEEHKHFDDIERAKDMNSGR